VAYNRGKLVYPQGVSESTGEGASWLPAEPTDGGELTEERTELMAAAAARPRPAATPNEPNGDASWLPHESSTAPTEATGGSPPSEEPPQPDGPPVAEPEPEPSEAAPSEPAIEREDTAARWLVEPAPATPDADAQPASAPALGTSPASGRLPDSSRASIPAAQPRDVLTADRRRALAVEAYCREVCSPERARAAVGEIVDSSSGMRDEELLRHTRTIAANYAPSKAPRRGWRRSEPAECEATPALLAARANEELDPERRDALERHLESCLNCQATELRAQRAERAFAGIGGVIAAQSPSPEPEPEQQRPVVAGPIAAPEQPAFIPEPIATPEPRPDVAEPILTPMTEAPTSEWIPTTAPVAIASGLSDVPPGPRPRRRRLSVVVAAAAAVAAVAIVAALVSSHTSKQPNVAGVATATIPVTSTPAPVHHKPAVKHRAAKKHHAAPKKHAVHHAAPVASAPPVVASVTPAASPTPSAPVSQPAPAPAPAPAPTPSSSSGSSSPPSVSISQPSLGSTGGKQGIK
jgi:hypothetical protein